MHSFGQKLAVDVNIHGQNFKDPKLATYEKASKLVASANRPHPWKFLLTKISITCFFNLSFRIDPGV